MAEHCPDGVEFQDIRERVMTKNGYTPAKSNSAYWIKGEAPWFRMDEYYHDFLLNFPKSEKEKHD